MSVELAAVRLLAPHFGSSVFVWTNVIGVVLAALAAGIFLGGRLADRRDPRSLLRATLAAAGVLCLLAPFLAKPLADFLVPPEAGLRLGDALPVFAAGSLAVSVVVFAPPLFFLGALSPAAVRALAARGAGVGAAAGSVLAVSTLGSLLGTFGTTHLLVPLAGVRNTFFVSSALLLLAVLALTPRAKGPLAALLALPAIAAAASGGGAPREVPAGEERLWAGETPYQFAEVVRRGEIRMLRVNEGLDSFQSLLVDGTPWTGAYYDFFALAPLLAGIEERGALRALVLGLGGGTVSRLFHDVHGARYALSIDGVELDPGLLRAARSFFDLTPARHPHLRVHAGVDGRVALRALPGPFEVVVLDAYAHQVHIPPHLASVEAFEAVRDRLAPGGVLAVNVGGFGFEDPVVSAIGGTIAAVFRTVEGVKVRDSRNVLIFARREGPLDWERARESASDPGLRALAGYAACPPVRHSFPPAGEGERLSDSDSRLDLLQIRSLWRAGLRS
jgi:spermidine synthase